MKTVDSYSCKVSSKWHPRRGRECIIRNINRDAPVGIQKLRHASLSVHGQRLFNTLPQYLRNITRCSVDSFKRRLDHYLLTIPDEPQIPGYTAQRRADSNSLLDMTRHANSYQDSMVELPGDTVTVTPGNSGVSFAIATI